jgi:transposase
MDLKRKHGHVTPELREMAIRAMREGGVSQGQLAEEIGVNRRTLQRWMREADLERSNEPLTKAERVELERLRREVKRIREENEILKKFQAFCARQKR